MRTGKFTRVRYLRISRMSIEIVNGLSEKEKALFLDISLEWFRKLENGEEIELVDTESALLNLALREEIAELQEGFDKYMQAVNSRKTADTIADTIADVPPIHLLEQNKQEKNKNINIEQIKSELVGIGYSADEIDKAYHSIDDWDGVQNPIGYIRKIIDNQRKRPKRVLPAQDFKQRDYTDVQDEILSSLAKEMAEEKKKVGK